ncbi:MAG: hypothetical protein AVO35_10235 [Candidatus Aegiribacteria sp. MLS_C]|nr:MAG: hypothetical protein AVO35_10235 [Candidatus Aegiribacteria sp. MLS_C]
MTGSCGVSVVVPVRNGFDALKGCLEALSGQTIRRRMQVVVSLDGHGPLPEALEHLADLVVEGPQAGPAAARNRGWRASSGSLVLFTDSDCVPEPSWAERMAQALESGADAVKGVYSRGGNRLVQRLAQVEFQERYRLLSRYSGVDMIDTYSAGYRREALEVSKGFDESFPFPDHEDVDLSYRLESMGMALRFAPDARVSHTHRATWSSYFRMKYGRGRWKTRVLRRYPAKAGSDTYTPRCLRLQILMCLLLPPTLLMLPFNLMPLAVWASLFLASSMPMALVALRNDPLTTPLVPVFAFWRGCALSAGLLRGIFGSGKETA